MKQLIQQLKSGQMEVIDVPSPSISNGQILVKNSFSVISSGTEGKTVADARKGYISKARSRQKEVAHVIELVKNQGLKSAYEIVMNKLEAPSTLGYSCAGEVIEVGPGINDIKPGDIVACGGQGAFHAEIVSVYRSLCVKVPGNIDLKQAAFTTIASIAMQGIRQAEVQMGGNCVVIGLGLIGQITMQLLNAAGIKSIGIDIDETKVLKALECGASAAWIRSHEMLEQMVFNLTAGLGTDAVIITAASSSNDPVELAGQLCRKKGKVVIVGAVPTNFSRESYYKKELDLRMSCSYGPGRYDPIYEEKGIDYPEGYVRWTENRNMQAYVNLLEAGKLNIEKLISHTYELKDARHAYDMILARKEPHLGIVIRYEKYVKADNTLEFKEERAAPGKNIAGLIGAGNFTRNVLLPGLKGLTTLSGIATAHGNTAYYSGKKYSFDFCTTDYHRIIEDPQIDTVYITTRHNLHASLVIDALKSGKNVFVEKPLTITYEELEGIKSTWLSNRGHILMTGYNRRFAPYIVSTLKQLPGDQPKAINIRVNAGSMPAEHWVNDPETGGGRLIGEGCHFIDLAIFLAGRPVISVSASELRTGNGLLDSFSATLNFRNGSIASISYFSNGNKQVSKELIEVFCNGTVTRIDDFKKLEYYGKRTIKSKMNQDKGHRNELKAFTDAVAKGLASPIPFEELYHSSLVTFKVIESIKTGKTIYIEHIF